MLRRTAKTKAPSTDADVLAVLANRGYRLPALILEYREQAKLKSTYIDALPRQVGSDGLIHTRFNQAVAATGRLSSSDPNLQNIPVRSALGAALARIPVRAGYARDPLRRALLTTRSRRPARAAVASRSRWSSATSASRARSAAPTPASRPSWRWTRRRVSAP